MIFKPDDAGRVLMQNPELKAGQLFHSSVWFSAKEEYFYCLFKFYYLG